MEPMRKKQKITTQKKKPEVTIPLITSTWVSAGKTRSYMMKDTLSDWLNLYGERKGYIRDSKTDNYSRDMDFGSFIMNKGVEFEDHLMVELGTKFPNIIKSPTQECYTECMTETMNLMRAGAPIIAQGLVFNKLTKTFGFPDLIVRSDYINKLVSEPAISCNVHGCIFSPDWHYRIVDIKFSTMKLAANATNMLNSGSQPAYKAQLYIYEQALAYMQDYSPKKAYILGRGWSLTKKNTTYTCDDPFSKLGIVDYNSYDSEMVEDCTEAIIWIRNLRLNGLHWTVTPVPSIPELYPNMSASHSTDWDTAKAQIAKELDEITMIWQCGPSQRDNAHENKIYKWSDPKCTSTVLGFKAGTRTAITVDKILEHNRSTTLDVRPAKIKSEMYNWRDSEAVELFIDFENVSFMNNKVNGNQSLLYLMGIGCCKTNIMSESSEWEFIPCVAEELTANGEKKTVEKFLDTLDDLNKREFSCENCSTKMRHNTYDHFMCMTCFWAYCPDNGWWDGSAQCRCCITEDEQPIILWHYSNAEVTLFNNVVDRIDFGDKKDKYESIIKRLEFRDLYNILKTEPVTISGAFNFSLKSIVKALHSLGKIDVTYTDCEISNGVDSILAAFIAGSSGEPFPEHNAIKEVITYNEVDCKSLYEILKYLRLNH